MQSTIKLIDPSTCTLVTVDPGVQGTGVSIWESARHSGTLTVENDDPYRATAPVTMHMLIMSKLESLRINPPHAGRMLLVFEDYGYGSGYFNSDVAEIIGMFKSHVHFSPSAFIGMVFISPTSVKKIVTGSGKASKADVKRAVKTLYPDIKTTTDHEADSLALFTAYCELWDKPSEAMVRRCILNGEPK